MAKNSKLLIIGDTIVDQYIFAEAVGLSLESPCIKTNFVSSQTIYGGAANVARIAAHLGAEVTFVTSVTKITEYHLRRQFNINVVNIKEERDHIKSRYFINKGNFTYQYLQLNDTKTNSGDFDWSPTNEYDAVAFSDYRLGLIDNKMIELIKATNLRTFAASQVSSNEPNFDLYTWTNHIVCNKDESTHLSSLNNVYVTDGKNGCTFNDQHFPGFEVPEPKQIIGAGDCFYAALLVYNDPEQANMIASKYVSGKL